jgi:hypothetical protein
MRAAAAAHRQARREGHRLHARHRLRAFDHRRPVGDELSGRAVVLAGGRHLHREDAVGDEAERHVDERHQASEEQAGAHEEHERQGHLGQHQSGARILPVAVTGRAARRLLERRLQLWTRCLPRRHDAEEHTGRDRQQQRERERLAVHADRRDARHVARIEREDEVHAPERQDHPEHAADHGEQHALGEQLPHQHRSIGADGGADGQLTRPHGGPRHQQIGDVRHHDEEHAANGAEQHQQRRARGAHELLLQGPRDADEVRRLIGIRGAQLVRDGGEFGVDAVERLAGFHPADGAQIVGTALGTRVGGAVGGQVVGGGHPEVGALREVHRDRHHAHHGVGRAVQPHGLVEGVGRPAEAALPEAVAEHDVLSPARRRVIAGELPAEDGRHAEHVEEGR